MVGQKLVEKLIKFGANVYIASKDSKKLANKNIINFYNTDLTVLKNCIKVTRNIDYVFNLLGITGSPKTASIVVSFLNCAIGFFDA